MAFKKVIFLVYPSIKVQLFIFVFFVRAEHYCTGSVCSLLKRKRCWWDREIRSKQLSTYPCNEKLGVLLLVSSIECFDHLLVKNYAGNGFEKSLFLTLLLILMSSCRPFENKNLNSSWSKFWQCLKLLL